jgi:hypothetical protein
VPVMVVVVAAVMVAVWQLGVMCPVTSPKQTW